MLIALHRDPADIDASRRQVLMSQRILRLHYAAGLLRNYSSESMSRLVNMYLLDAGGARVAFKILRERVRRERRAGPTRSIVPRPERAVTSERTHPVA